MFNDFKTSVKLTFKNKQILRTKRLMTYDLGIVIDLRQKYYLFYIQIPENKRILFQGSK